MCTNLFCFFYLAPSGSSGSGGVSFSPSLVSGPSSGGGGEWLDPQFFCSCPSGTFGSRCEKGRWCKTSEGGGSSISSSSDYLRISQQNSESNSGDGEVCKHHGECEDGPSGPICWCSGGYTGATCQLDIVRILTMHKAITLF